MTYQKLKNLRYLEFEKKRLERKLRELRSDMGSLCSPSLSGMPSAPGRLSQPERETEKLDETKRRYEERLKVYSAELLEAQQYIDGIDDSYTRLIFCMRFIDGFSWQKIALTVGGGNSPDGMRKVVVRYLEKHP